MMKGKDKKAVPRRNVGTRGPGFCTEEVMTLLTLVKEYKPIHGDDWSKIAREFNSKYKRYPRTWRSLSQKFTIIASKKVGTGQTEIPKDVELAREAQEAINEAMELKGGSDVESAFTGPSVNGEDVGSQVEEDVADVAEEGVEDDKE